MTGRDKVFQELLDYVSSHGHTNNTTYGLIVVGCCFVIFAPMFDESVVPK